MNVARALDLIRNQLYRPRLSTYRALCVRVVRVVVCPGDARRLSTYRARGVDPKGRGGVAAA